MWRRLLCFEDVETCMTGAQWGAKYLLPSIHPVYLLHDMVCKRFDVVQLMMCLYESISTLEILTCFTQNKSGH